MYAFIFGDKAQGAAQSVMDSSDVRNVRGFTSIGDFLSIANRQGLVFNRIVILVSYVSSEQEFQSLRRYCSEVAPQTEIVILARGFEASDKTVLESYYSIFTSPIYTDYSLSMQEPTSNLLLKNLLTTPIDDIRVNHSINKDVKPVVKMSVHSETQAQPERVSKPSAMKSKGGLIKTFSYGGKIFGKKKYTKQQLNEVIRLEAEANVIFNLMGVK